MTGGVFGFLIGYIVTTHCPGLVRKLAGRGGGGWISLRVPLTKALICLALIFVGAVAGGIFGAIGVKY